VTNILRIIGVVGSVIVIGALLLYISVLRSGYYQPHLEERSRVGAAWREKGIEIAVVWPDLAQSGRTLPTFPEGVQIGLEQLRAEAAKNYQPGEVAAVDKIKLIRYNEPPDNSSQGGQELAHRIVRNGNIVAVLGTLVTAHTIPASIVYEQHGILFITPGSTDPRLTQHQFVYTFRITPRDHDIADAMVQFAASKGWARVGLLFARSPSGEAIAPQITEEVGTNKDTTMVFTRSYIPYPQNFAELPDFRPMIAAVRPMQPDAVFLADSLPRSAKVVKDIRDMGLEWPIIGVGKLEAAELPANIVAASRNVWLATGVNPDETTPEFVEFRRRFRERHHIDPPMPAVDGFEALKVLVNAIEKSGSADPLVVATTLHEYPFDGLYGPFEFSDWGDVQCRSVTIRQPVLTINPTPPPPATVVFETRFELKAANEHLPCSCRRPKETCP
jgi:branched-chain amino acid transport system substrate-binding protein